MRHAKFVLLFLVFVLASHAGAIFTENFEGATPGYDSTVGPITGTLFSLLAGTIDVNGPAKGSTPAWYPQLCIAPTSGNCIDTTGGSNPTRGTIATTSPIVFAPGQYVLSFDLEGWYDLPYTDATATVQVDLGSLIVGQQFTVDGADNPYAAVTIPFLVTTSTSATLQFTDLSGNYPFAGAILDNISIGDPPTVPEPSYVLLFGAGAMIVLARTRVRQ